MFLLMLLLVGLRGLLASGPGKAAETLVHWVWAEEGVSFSNFNEFLLLSNGGPTRFRSAFWFLLAGQPGNPAFRGRSVGIDK